MFISLAFKWLRKHGNYVTGFLDDLRGLELHAYLFSLESA